MLDNQFRICALGELFDPDAYLASSQLKVDGLWRKGESGGGRSSGIFKDLGNGLVVPFRQQEQIAIEYLGANREALIALANCPEITAFSIGLQYPIVRDSTLMSFCVGPSALFMWHCLEVGISPHYYISIEYDEPEMTSN